MLPRGRKTNRPVMLPAGYQERLAEQFCWTALDILHERERVKPDALGRTFPWVHSHNVAAHLHLANTRMLGIIEELLQVWQPGKSLPPGPILVSDADFIDMRIPVCTMDGNIDRAKLLDDAIRQAQAAVTIAFNRWYESRLKTRLRAPSKVSMSDKIHAAVLHICFGLSFDEVPNHVPSMESADPRTIKAAVQDVRELLADYL